MRIITCDVCGEQYQPTDDMIEMVIPASFLDDEGDSIRVDVCSWPCVSGVVDSALKSIDETPDAPEEEVEQHTEIPVIPHVDEQMTEKLLAEYTQAVTGVKRR